MMRLTNPFRALRPTKALTEVQPQSSDPNPHHALQCEALDAHDCKATLYLSPDLPGELRLSIQPQGEHGEPARVAFRGPGEETAQGRLTVHGESAATVRAVCGIAVRYAAMPVQATFDFDIGQFRLHFAETSLALPTRFRFDASAEALDHCKRALRTKASMPTRKQASTRN